MPGGMNNTAKGDPESLKKIVMVVYALQAASFVVVLSWVAGLVIDYIKQPEARGTWLESHVRWQIRTFWFALLWSILGSFTLFVGIGFFVLAANLVWMIYRIAKGWLRLSEGRGMYS